MKKKKILVVNARYYEEIIINLYKDVKFFLKNKVKHDVVNVPGIFEIPVVISKNINKYDGFIALGCVIKGETPHFDFISKATTEAIMKLSIDSKKPIGNGILTCLNYKQAKNRSMKKREKEGKGIEAARALIEVLNNF